MAWRLHLERPWINGGPVSLQGFTAALEGLFGQRRPLNSVIGWVCGTPFCFVEKQWQTKQPASISGVWRIAN
ncbi:hypothetical protein [Caballeronia sp. 15711]|uniref:hypothetical protein n=1 Tax=Caballeronia sp. 15711 TaxID=3391029 RepID=UPI0039E32ECB